MFLIVVVNLITKKYSVLIPDYLFVSLLSRFPVIHIHTYIHTFDGRCGVVVYILAYYARGRGFDSRTVQTFVCMNMPVCIGSGCFYV
jgi:hypothetical protein